MAYRASELASEVAQVREGKRKGENHSHTFFCSHARTSWLFCRVGTLGR